MSTFTVPLVVITKIEKHANADTLSITEAEGCPVIFRTGDYKIGDYAIYIPIEAMVPLDNPAFAFLSNKEGQKSYRVKAKKLRGIFSMGLLAPLSALPEGTPINTNGQPNDFAEVLKIVKYTEPVKNMKLGGHREGRQPDSATAPIYDVESFRKYKTTFWDFERVIATEKIHGCNARFVFRKGEEDLEPRLYVGSRNFFMKETDADVWWQTARSQHLKEKLGHLLFQDMVLYGEIFGQVQDLKYGTTAAEPLRFAAFDVYDKKIGRYLDYDDFVKFCIQLDIPMAPVLYDGPFKDMPQTLCDGKSLLADQMREGFVVKPAMERWDGRLGRVMAKLVGEEYLLRKGGTEFQ